MLHRSKDFLRAKPEPGTFRIIYGHDIFNEDGNYSFRRTVEAIKGRESYAVCSGKKNLDGRKKHLSAPSGVSSIESYCNRNREVIVCRRRSHKGDKRRFVGVYLSSELPEGYFLENGLNFIFQTPEHSLSAPPLASVFRILRSDVFERFMAIVSSNTQINKNDMYLFGIPESDGRTKKLYQKLELTDGNDLKVINEIVGKLYELPE